MSLIDQLWDPHSLSLCKETSGEHLAIVNHHFCSGGSHRFEMACEW